MSLVLCPECNSKISDKATMCPHCGFVASCSEKAVELKTVPQKERIALISIPDAEIINGVCLVSELERRKITELLKDAEAVARYAPAIYDAVQQAMAERGTMWAADFSSAAEKLMKAGDLILGRDKEGRILPCLKNADTGRFYEQVRLIEVEMPDGLASSLATLQIQVAQAQILNEIKSVAQSVEALRLEIRGDRIGRAKGVWQRLQQATRIADSRLREQQVLGIAASATEQRCIMQENFKVELRLAGSSNGKRVDKGNAAKNAIDALAAISLMARAEYAALFLVGELDAADMALKQFGQFIDENDLAKKDTLLALNSRASENLQEMVEGFWQIAVNATNLGLTAGGEETEIRLFEGGKDER